MDQVGEVVKIGDDSRIGAIPMERTADMQKAKESLDACCVPVRLPRGHYFVVKHDDEIALLEPFKFGRHSRAQVFWITEARNLVRRCSVYSDTLPVFVETDHSRPWIHHKPPSQLAAVWHYMDDWKFRSWLQEGGICLTRADKSKLKDDREGTLSLSNIRYRNQVYPHGEAMRAAYYDYSQELQRISHYTYISCWRMDEKEHPRCWSEYTHGRDAVAIKTNYGAIFRHTHAIFCARVEYIDYIKNWVAEGNSLYPFMYKNKKDYEWESEFRIIYQKLPRSEIIFRNTPSFDCSSENPNCAVTLQVDLPRLIHQIVLSPSASVSFRKEVEVLCSKYNLRNRVCPSILG